MTATIISDDGVADVDGAVVAPVDLRRAIGWELKPQGLCRGDVCVPLLGRDIETGDGRIDLHAVAEVLRAPFVFDDETGVGVFGASADLRAGQHNGMHVDDFELCDADGRPVRWSTIGRKKKLLFAWASW